MRDRILSGIRPTGQLHLGHYFGAVENWVKLQADYECMSMIADWHAVMSDYKDTSKLVEYSYDIVADLIACGIDPDKSTIFIQSSVSEHAELHLALSFVTSIGMLERCPTYKEQIKELKDVDLSHYAFLGYPVLQAADILLYKAKVVPVGEDQVSHLEIVREIARKFNATFAREIFPEPQAKLTKTPRILGIDGFRKMSKSLNNNIKISEEPSSLKKKVLSMFTDPARVTRQDPGHPEKCNVYTFHTIFTKESRTAQIKLECQTAKIGCVECKAELAENLLNYFKPMREKKEKLLAKPDELKDIVRAGNEKARSIARQTMKEVKEVIFKSNGI